MCSSSDRRNMSGKLSVVRNSSSGGKSLKSSSGMTSCSLTLCEPTRTTGVLKASCRKGGEERGEEEGEEGGQEGREEGGEEGERREEMNGIVRKK